MFCRVNSTYKQQILKTPQSEVISQQSGAIKTPQWFSRELIRGREWLEPREGTSEEVFFENISGVNKKPKV